MNSRGLCRLLFLAAWMFPIAWAHANDVKSVLANDVWTLSDAERARLEAEAARVFGLSSCRLKTIPPLTALDTVSVAVEIRGNTRSLTLQRNSLRTSNFSLQVDDGTLRSVDPPPVRTYTGWLAEDPTASVAASITEDGQLQAMILLGSDTWYVEPVGQVGPGTPRNLHVVYGKHDVKPAGGRCGTDGSLLLAQRMADADDVSQALFPGNGLTEIAFDADVEFYQLNGSSVPSTVSDIEMILNFVNHTYQLQVDICYTITGVIVRTTEPDPYSATDSTALLCQFTSHWSTTNPVGRDVAHLMTGKELDGLTVGVGWIGTICAGIFDLTNVCPGLPDGRADYALSQSRFSNSIAGRHNVTAHELGHNWGACHCDIGTCTGGGPDPDCGIMNSFVDGSTTFGSRSRATITTHRDSIGCLGVCGGDPPDCDGDGISNQLEIALGAPDCNGNAIPDSCDVASGVPDCTGNGIPDSCETAPDCNGNGKSDLNDTCSGFSLDCTGNMVPDECEMTPDCDSNGAADFNDLCNGTGFDCNFNGVLDACDLFGPSEDCNNDDLPDECNIWRGDSFDCNINGTPDECESPNCNADLVLFDINSGGTRSSGGVYALTASTAQHGGVGKLTSFSNTYTLADGFWHAAAPAGCPCTTLADCRNSTCMDDNGCNHATCVSGTCVFTCERYGDVQPAGGNGIVNIDDILCILGGFASYQSCPNADINPCGGNATINLDDILSVLVAFAGGNPCSCTENASPGAGAPALCGSSQP